MVKMESCTGATGGGQCSCRNEQNSNLNSKVKVKSYLVDNISIAAGAIKSVIFEDTLIPGYSRMMGTARILNASSGGTGSSLCNDYTIWLAYDRGDGDTSDSSVNIKNFASTAAKILVELKILYASGSTSF